MKLEYLMSYEGTLSPAFQPVGKGPFGDRMIAEVTGGTFEGPRLKGELLTCGGDWILTGDVTPGHVMTSMVVLPLVIFFTCLGMIASIHRFAKKGVVHATVWGVITGCYLLSLWFPMVFWTIMRVLTRKERFLTWAKTERFGDVSAA